MKTIALISSLDTKEEEILYAKELIEKRGMYTFLIDLSTRRLENAHADLKAKEILEAAGIGRTRSGAWIKQLVSVPWRMLPELPRCHMKPGSYLQFMKTGAGQLHISAGTSMGLWSLLQEMAAISLTLTICVMSAG
ncbi:hypothetical protein EAI28_17390 [Faecalicatena contorta]|nr:hypothetical protein [Faecalicatena contorta]